MVRLLAEGNSQRNGPGGPGQDLCDGDNVWRDEKEWPLARTKYTKYYLHSGGQGEQPIWGRGAEHGTRPDRSRPTRTLMIHTTQCQRWAGTPAAATQPRSDGPRENRVAEVRPDVLVYTTPPLIEDVE